MPELYPAEDLYPVESLYPGEAPEGESTPTPPPRRRRKPPLQLDVEVEAANGDTFRLEADSRKRGKRFSGLNFSTQRGDGFATGGVALARRILRDYPDLNLLDTWRFVSRSGQVAYEGRHQANPRVNDPHQQIQVALVGWMNYLKSRGKISPLIIDRRLSSWREPSMQRRAYLHELGRLLNASVDAAYRDSGTLDAGLAFTIGRLSTGFQATGESWFYGGGEAIGKLLYDYKQISTWSAPDAAWANVAHLAEDDVAKTGHQSGTNHQRVSASGQSITATTNTRRYAFIENFRAATVNEDNSNVDGWLNLAVLGDHDLPLTGNAGEEGPELTDVIRYILETYYPKVELAGQHYSYPIKQATYHDSPALGYDILQQLNDLVLGETNMWEGPTLHHEPADLTTYDWIIDLDAPGVTVRFDGDSIEDFANGIVVVYTDLLTGARKLLHPEDHAELRDESESNPANLHGEPLHIDIEISRPCFEADALQHGRAYLAEHNRPKRPGAFRISGGYLEDAEGHEHPPWEARNSQTIGVRNHPYDAPRLVTSTNWNEESLSLDITVDAPPKTLDALAAREARAREAANL
jgi:hypothetical protein